MANAKERERKERQVKREKKRKGTEAQRVKLPTLSRTTDALKGDEEQNGKQKKEKRQTERTIQSSPTTCTDHTVSLFVLPTPPKGGEVLGGETKTLRGENLLQIRIGINVHKKGVHLLFLYI